MLLYHLQKMAVSRVRRFYNLKDHFIRLREQGMLNRKEMLNFLDISDATLRSWKNKGFIKVYAYGNTRNNFLYEVPDEKFYAKIINKI